MPFARSLVQTAVLTAALSTFLVSPATAAPASGDAAASDAASSSAAETSSASSGIPTTAGVGTITVNGLRLRSAPSTEASVLTAASQGQKVILLNETENATDGWYKVNFHAVEGYMSEDYISAVEKEDGDFGTGRVTTAGNPLNIRSGPGKTYPCLSTLENRAEVSIIGVDNSWYKITYENLTGYVSSEYLTVTHTNTYTSPSEANPANVPLTVSAAATSETASMGQKIVNYAKQFLGTPYAWGGNGPNSFDCSGFTKYVFAHFGYSISRTASAQFQNGKRVSYGQLQPGDLIFFDNGKVSTPVSHVGIYVGQGQFIHASTNTHAVQYSNLSMSYYANTYAGARRII